MTLALVFLLREWISSRIKKSIENEYKVKQMELKAELDGKLEETKAGYKKVLDENQIRFSRLHAEQADAIKVLYKLLVGLESKMKGFVNPLQMAPRDPQKSFEFFDRQRKEAVEAFDECNATFQPMRIFLPEGACKEVHKLLEIAKTAYIDYTSPGGPVNDEASEPKMSEYQAMKGTFASARRQLEDRFREILGFLPAVEDGLAAKSVE